MLPIAPNSLLQQRYRILQILGEGRFGRTYLATDSTGTNLASPSQVEEYYAIAELAPSAQFPATVAKAKATFKQQVELLYQLNHPQLPRFRAIFEEQNRLFIVQDYIEGKTYGQLLDDRRNLGTQFSEFEVWQFLLQILPVIGYMHDQGVIHLNISPDNIVCRDSNRLPVPIDFGVVKEFANKLQPHPTSQVNIAITKPGYAAPEQVSTGKVYPNSDLYSLAVTAIVLLTGKEPIALFEGDSPAERLRQRMNWDWRKWTQISDGFATVLQRMLSPQPGDRYRSATEVLQELELLNIPNQSPGSLKQPLGNQPSPYPNHPSELPTMPVGGKPTPSAPNRVQSAITNLNIKSVWEKPQVFIPLGVLISLLAGFGSWLGVTNLMHNNKLSSPVASNPPKQVDFNNPTIPTDTNPSPTSNTIEPVMGKSILREGTVSANTPVRYQIAAVGGQNLDLQLVPIGTQSIDPLKSSPAPDATKLNPDRTKAIKSPTAAPSPSIAPITATQVLMTVLSPAGTPIDAQADRVVSWRGEIPSTGEYTIEIRPIAGLAGNAFPYKLSVTQIAAATSPPAIGDPYGTTPPVVAPVPGDGRNALPGGGSYQTKPDNTLPNVTPSPIPILIPTTRPSVAPNEPEQPKTRAPKRNRIEEEPQQPTRTRRQSSNDDTPPPSRRRKRSTTSDTPTKPAPAVSPEPDRPDTNANPQSEPAQTPPTSDNQAPQPNTTDGGNSTPPTKEPKSSPSPTSGSTIDPD